MTLLARLRQGNDDQYRALPLAADLTEDVRDAMTSRLELLIGQNIEAVEFDPGYMLADGEVFKMVDETITHQLNSAFKNTATMDRLQDVDIQAQSLVGLFGRWDFNGSPLIVGQSLSKAYLLQRGGDLVSLLWHDKNNYIRFTGHGVTVRRSTDIAIIDNEIRFLNYQSATRLINLSRHFEAASNQTLREFAKSNHLAIDDCQALEASADIWIRKKISLILKRRVLERASVESILAAAEKEKLAVEVRNVDGVKKIILPASKAELKKLLQFLDEDLFIGQLTGDSFITSSKRKA